MTTLPMRTDTVSRHQLQRGIEEKRQADAGLRWEQSFGRATRTFWWDPTWVRVRSTMPGSPPKTSVAGGSQAGGVA